MGYPMLGIECDSFSSHLGGSKVYNGPFCCFGIAVLNYFEFKYKFEIQLKKTRNDFEIVLIYPFGGLLMLLLLKPSIKLV